MTVLFYLQFEFFVMVIIKDNILMASPYKSNGEYHIAIDLNNKSRSTKLLNTLLSNFYP
ncbi:protein of unknown function [Candidatus Nitrosocosmicus franklandus]|uniref:Uncharacterized protein n=1 Tax=Candidatus Nitrosocosmicus franklandianus TaxID=1798806 RepID=A0A484IDU1_9ARCH|nr:protein of unknown function [Candidatus Nitrosocosmicus franklandus]